MLCCVLLTVSYQGVHDIDMSYYGDVNLHHVVKMVSVGFLCSTATIFPLVISNYLEKDTTVQIPCISSNIYPLI